MNTLPSILLHLDDSPRCPDRIAMARQLAQRHGAALDTLYAVEPVFIAMPFTPAEGSSMAAMALRLNEDRRERARAQFDRAMAEPGVAAEWSEMGSNLRPVHTK